MYNVVRTAMVEKQKRQLALGKSKLESKEIQLQKDRKIISEDKKKAVKKLESAYKLQKSIAKIERRLERLSKKLEEKEAKLKFKLDIVDLELKKQQLVSENSIEIRNKLIASDVELATKMKDLKEKEEKLNSWQKDLEQREELIRLSIKNPTKSVDPQTQKIHLDSNHGNNSHSQFTCNDCGMNFFNWHVMQRHRVKHMNQNILCKHCDGQFSRHENLQRHCRSVHKIFY